MEDPGSFPNYKHLRPYPLLCRLADTRGWCLGLEWYSSERFTLHIYGAEDVLLASALSEIEAPECLVDLSRKILHELNNKGHIQIKSKGKKV